MGLKCEKAYRKLGATVACAKVSVKGVFAGARQTERTRDKRIIDHPRSNKNPPGNNETVSHTQTDPSRVRKRPATMLVAESPEMENQPMCTPGRSQVVHGKCAGGTYIGVLPNNELFLELQAAVTDHFEIISKAYAGEQALEEIEKKYERQLCQNDSRIQRIERGGSDAEREQLRGLKSQATQIQLLAESRLKNKGDQIREELEEFYQAQRCQLTRLFGKIGGLFAEYKLMDPIVIPSRAGGARDSPNTGPDGPQRGGTNASATSRNPGIHGDARDSANQVQNDPSDHQENLRDQREHRTDNAEKISLQKQEDTDRKQTLRRNYQSTRLNLRLRERTFEDRDDRLDHEACERQKALANGEEVEPPLIYDMRQLEWSRRVTRELIEAEAEYREAKYAAIAGGIKLEEMGTEVDSGFIDDVDDGYRLSEDAEEIAVSKGGYPWCSWLDKLPDLDTSEALATDLEQCAPTEVEIDEWDANSVDICESRSARAEDPWRRRIDKWRETCGLS